MVLIYQNCTVIVLPCHRKYPMVSWLISVFSLYFSFFILRKKTISLINGRCHEDVSGINVREILLARETALTRRVETFFFEWLRMRCFYVLLTPNS